MKSIALIFCILASVYSLNGVAMPSSKDVQTMIKNGDENAISKLVKEGVDFVEIQKQGGNWSTSVLDVAVYFNRANILKILLNHQPELADIYGEDALVTACATNKQNKTLIKILLNSGVDINAKSKSGKTCLYRAALAADAKFFIYLLGLGANPKIEVTPEKSLHIAGPVSIDDFIYIRLKSYEEMTAHVKKYSGLNQ